MAFKYRGGDRTTEEVTRRAKQSGGSYDSYLDPEAQFYKSRDGENAIRIMPPTWDDKKKWGTGWEIQVWLHRNVGPDNGTYLCLDKMLGKPCPCCDARREAVDEDDADALRPQWRALCYVIDRNNEKAGPQVDGMPITLFREINSRSVSRKGKGLLLIDGDEENMGHDILYTRSGAKKQTKYEAVEVESEATPLHEEVKTEQRWLDYIEDNPLPEMLVYYPYEHIEKVLFGKAERRKKGGEDEGDEPQEGTRSRRRGRAEPEAEPTTTRRRGRTEPDEPEETEDRGGTTGRRRGRAEPEEEAEPEATPRRRGRAEPEEAEPSTRRRGRAEPEPEDDAETEATPRRRGRAEPEAEPEARGAVARRRAAPAADEDDGEDDPSTQARQRLGRLRDRGK